MHHREESCPYISADNSRCSSSAADEPLKYASKEVCIALEKAVRQLDDKKVDAKFTQLLDEIVADSKKGRGIAISLRLL